MKLVNININLNIFNVHKIAKIRAIFNIQKITNCACNQTYYSVLHSTTQESIFLYKYIIQMKIQNTKTLPFDPYLLYLAKKHPDSDAIILQILTQLFQQSFAALSSYQHSEHKMFNDRFANTMQNPAQQEDVHCRIILKAILNKTSAENLLQEFGLLPLSQRYPFNENNYFLIYLCTRIKQVTNDKTKCKFSKMCKILKIPQNQIEYIVKYQQPSTAKDVAVNKQTIFNLRFNFMISNRMSLKPFLDSYVNSLLRIVQTKVRFQDLEQDQFQQLENPCFQMFSTQTWLTYLDIQSQNDWNSKKAYQFKTQLKLHQIQLQNKLNRLIQHPKCFIGETLYRREQKHLRKIYLNKNKEQYSDYFLFNLDWNHDYLGNQIITLNSQHTKNIAKAIKTNKMQEPLLNNSTPSQSEVKIQEGQQKSVQMDLQPFDLVSSQQNNDQSQLSQNISDQQDQSQEHSHSLKSNQQMIKNNMQRQKKCINKVSSYFKDWLLFLMKKANHFDQRVYGGRLNISRSQLKQYLQSKSQISFFGTAYPRKLKNIMQNNYNYRVNDDDQLKLLQIISCQSSQYQHNNQFQAYLKLHNIQIKEKQTKGKYIRKKAKQSKSPAAISKLSFSIPKISVAVSKSNAIVPKTTKKIAKRQTNRKYFQLQQLRNTRNSMRSNQQIQLQKPQILQNIRQKVRVSQKCERMLNKQHPKPTQVSYETKLCNKNDQNQLKAHKKTKQQNSRVNNLSQQIKQRPFQKQEVDEQKAVKVKPVKPVIMNSKQIAQKNVLIYLTLKQYDISNPMVQIILDQTTQQIKQYHRFNILSIQRTGKQYVQFYEKHPKLIQQEESTKNIMRALLKTHLMKTY